MNVEVIKRKCRLPIDAVGCVEDRSGSKDRATAGLRESTKASALEGDLERQRVGWNLASTDDFVIGNHLVLAVKNDRSGITGEHHALGSGCKK